jgi:hypothetical protein
MAPNQHEPDAHEHTLHKKAREGVSEREKEREREREREGGRKRERERDGGRGRERECMQTITALLPQPLFHPSNLHLPLISRVAVWNVAMNI